MQAKNREGDTPLHLAATSGYGGELVWVLLDLGADLWVKNFCGETTLHCKY